MPCCGLGILSTVSRFRNHDSPLVVMGLNGASKQHNCAWYWTARLDKRTMSLMSLALRLETVMVRTRSSRPRILVSTEIPIPTNRHVPDWMPNAVAVAFHHHGKQEHAHLILVKITVWNFLMWPTKT